MEQQLSRREFNKGMLAALGGGAIALLFGMNSAGGGILETDPLAVLRSPVGTQSILPKATGFDPNNGRILSFLDPSANSGVKRGFSIISDNGAGLQPQFHLLRQSADGVQGMFIIETVDTLLQQGVIAYDPLNNLGFGNDALVLGDNGVVAGTPIGIIGILAGAGGLDLTKVLLVAPLTPSSCFISPALIGTANGVSRPDHTHQISTSSSLIPSPVALAGTRGSSILIPRFDHAHKALPGTVALINADETQISGTVPNVDTVAKTYTLAANTYTSIIVEAEGFVKFVALSTNQLINIKIKFAGVQVGQTMVLDAALGANSTIPFPIKASGGFQAGGTITITVSAAATDINTNIFFNSLRVYGVV